jgi:hypothetical protein
VSSGVGRFLSSVAATLLHELSADPSLCGGWAEVETDQSQHQATGAKNKVRTKSGAVHWHP